MNDWIALIFCAALVATCYRVMTLSCWSGIIDPWTCPRCGTTRVDMLKNRGWQRTISVSGKPIDVKFGVIRFGGRK